MFGELNMEKISFRETGGCCFLELSVFFLSGFDRIYGDL